MQILPDVENEMGSVNVVHFISCTAKYKNKK